MIVAIDGSAATGKSTSAKKVARELGFTHLDTGAMYRCVTLSVLRDQITLDNESALSQLLNDLDIRLEKLNDELVVYLNGEDVSDEIRKAEVTSYVSTVSAVSQVRNALVRVQRNIAKNQDCVVEGRDIGTVVFPDAEFKFFLAPIKIRLIKFRLKHVLYWREKISM